MLAHQRGMIASFMPKPFTNRTGSGMHLHLSLWRDGQGLFPASSDDRGLGLHPLAYQFIGGLLEHAPALHALANPTVNSYKRTGATTTASGATWAPRFASYGGNDRTHLVRVPDGNRVEFRGADGAANPYLATAGALAAGMDGIDRAVDPGLPGAGASGRPLPRTLLDAVQELQSDDCMRAVLDDADPSAGVSAYYAELKRQEFYDWHAAVSAWEIDRYLV
jgi:glutamine synthetase